MLKRIWIAGLLILAIAFMMTACGGDDEPSANTGENGTTVSETVSAEDTNEETPETTDEETEEETPLDSWTHNY